VTSSAFFSFIERKQIPLTREEINDIIGCYGDKNHNIDYNQMLQDMEQIFRSKQSISVDQRRVFEEIRKTLERDRSHSKLMQ